MCVGTDCDNREVGTALVKLAEKKLLHCYVVHTAIEVYSHRGEMYLPFRADLLSIQLQRAEDPRQRWVALEMPIKGAGKNGSGDWTPAERH